MLIPIKKIILENNLGLTSSLATVLGESFKKYKDINKTTPLSKGITKLSQKTNNQIKDDSEIYNSSGSIKDNSNNFSLGDS